MSSRFCRTAYCYIHPVNHLNEKNRALVQAQIAIHYTYSHFVCSVKCIAFFSSFHAHF